MGLELQVNVDLPLDASGLHLSLRGRFDRVTRGAASTVVVGDYKSAGRLPRHVEPAGILKGHRIQMPLYVLMAEKLAASWGVEGAAASAEVIGVGPEHVAGLTPDETGTGEPPGRAELPAEKFDEIRAGFMETLRVLHALAEGGRFPLREGDRCRYCPYDRACRRLHAPSVARIASAPGMRHFQLLDGKSTRARTLAEVDGARAKELP